MPEWPKVLRKKNVFAVCAARGIMSKACSRKKERDPAV